MSRASWAKDLARWLGRVGKARKSRGKGDPRRRALHMFPLESLEQRSLLTMTIGIGDVVVSEPETGSANVTFTATLSEVPSSDVVVDWITANGTATTANNDYTASSGTITFSPGQITKTFTVPVLADTVQEPDETFFVNLTPPSGVTVSPLPKSLYFGGVKAAE